MFKIIDRNKWSREPYFKHFFNNVRCTYSITANVEITKALEFSRSKGCKLYPVLLFCLTKVVNRHEEFRTSFNDRGELGIWEQMHPCFTYFHNDTETFSNIWTGFDEDFDRFLNAYQEDITKYGDVHEMYAKPDAPANIFPVSMIPWTTFTAFNLNIFAEGDYLLPIFTFGKYIAEGEKTLIPLSVQVHHGVCDGFHVSRFIRELEEMLNTQL